MGIPAEVWQRACRLATSVSMVVAIGLVVLVHLPEQLRHLEYDIKLGTGSAGICCIVLQAPLIGILARSGLENSVGTVVGASAGYGSFILGRLVVQALALSDASFWQYVTRAACAPLVGVAGTIAGYLLGLEVSGKLVLLTYLLVAINQTDVGHAKEAAVTRTVAILTGVACSQIAQLVVFPQSATNAALQLYHKSLTNLCALHACVWELAGDGVVVTREASIVASAGSITAILPPELALHHRLILAAPDPEAAEVDDKLDGHYAAVNDTLNIVLANVKAASHELYLGRLNNSCAIYLPLPRFADCHTHMPTEEFMQAVQAVRRTGRLIYSMQQMLRARRSATLPGAQASAGRLSPLLAPLASELQGALEDAAVAFQMRKEVPMRHLRALAQLMPLAVQLQSPPALGMASVPPSLSPLPTPSFINGMSDEMQPLLTVLGVGASPPLAQDMEQRLLPSRQKAAGTPEGLRALAAMAGSIGEGPSSSIQDFSADARAGAVWGFLLEEVVHQVYALHAAVTRLGLLCRGL